MSSLNRIQSILVTVSSIIGIVVGAIFLGDRFQLWGSFSNLSPAEAVFVLVILGDFILDAKSPKYL